MIGHHLRDGVDSSDLQNEEGIAKTGGIEVDIVEIHKNTTVAHWSSAVDNNSGACWTKDGARRWQAPCANKCRTHAACKIGSEHCDCAASIHLPGIDWNRH